jgi:hypothetical protein
MCWGLALVYALRNRRQSPVKYAVQTSPNLQSSAAHTTANAKRIRFTAPSAVSYKFLQTCGRVYGNNFSCGSLVQHLDDKETVDVDNNHNLSSVKTLSCPLRFCDILYGNFSVYKFCRSASYFKRSLSALIWMQVTGPEAL